MKNNRGQESGRVLIAGLGNCLLMDDGVGVHAIRCLQEDPPDSMKAGNIVLAEIGTAVLDALHLLEKADIVIGLDAIQAGRPPGTIVEISGASLQDPQGGSIHELGLWQAIRMLPEEHRPELVILGIEPQRIDYGEALSETVSSALPSFVDLVKDRMKSLSRLPNEGGE